MSKQVKLYLVQSSPNILCVASTASAYKQDCSKAGRIILFTSFILGTGAVRGNIRPSRCYWAVCEDEQGALRGIDWTSACIRTCKEWKFEIWCCCWWWWWLWCCCRTCFLMVASTLRCTHTHEVCASVGEISPLSTQCNFLRTYNDLRAFPSNVRWYESYGYWNYWDRESVSQSNSCSFLTPSWVKWSRSSHLFALVVPSYKILFEDSFAA